MALYIAMDDVECAERFMAATEQAFQFLAQTPGARSRRDYFGGALASLRVWPVRGFEKHLIFYRDTGKELDILRVLHAARDIAALFEDEDSEDCVDHLD